MNFATADSKLTQRLPLSIAILSCMRPHYLQDVLLSLRPQVTDGDEIFLFQDGGWNPLSGRRVVSEAVINCCVAVFKSAFPGGRVFRSADNLGIAGNYRRAESYIFKTLIKPVALFLEDDLLLAPNYLLVTSDLIELALRNDRIGYVSAYGDLWASLAQQKRECGQLMRMHENWGAAMTRASWLVQRPVREQYWQIVRDCDYKFRLQDKIRDLYSFLGFNVAYTTQDSSRWIACLVCNMVRLTTSTCHARYIGAVGEHSDNSYYRRYNFDRSVFFDGRPILSMPTNQMIDEWFEAEFAQFRQGYRHPYLLSG